MTVEQGPQRIRGGGMRPVDFGAGLRRLSRSAGVARQLARYAIVSALALGLDFGVFLGLNTLIGRPTLTGVVGYACGLAVHYHLSKRFVFDVSGLAKSGRRLFSEFAASGIVGLAVTAGAIALATGALGLGPIAAKVLAVGASFLGVFLIRRTIVFA